MSYYNSGYLVKKNLNKKFFNDFFLSFIKICRIYAPTYFESKKKYTGWNCSSLSKNSTSIAPTVEAFCNKIFKAFHSSFIKLLSLKNFLIL